MVTTRRSIRFAMIAAALLAAQAGQAQIPKEICDAMKGMAPNARHARGYTPLMCAATAGDLEAIKRLLANGADIHATVGPSATALTFAAGMARYDAIALLVEHGARVDDSALFFAAYGVGRAKPGNDYARTVHLLLKHGGNPNARQQGVQGALQTPLMVVIMVATQAGFTDTEVMKALLEGGANPNERNELGETPLLLAVLEGRATATQLLLEHGARVNEMVGPPGRTGTPLTFAMRLATSLGFNPGDKTRSDADFSGTVRALLKHGADPNVRSFEGDTPLIQVIRQRSDELAAVLLDAGADANAATAKGETPLLLAASHGNAKAVQMLLGRGARVNDGGAALLATIAGRPDIPAWAGQDYPASARALLNGGADPNVRSTQGDTPLTLAFRTLNDASELPKILLDGGASTEFANGKGEKPLVVALNAGRTRGVELLLARDARLNDRGADGNTPLITAIKIDNPQAIRLLLRKGADRSLKDGNGKTAAQVAPLFSEAGELLLGREPLRTSKTIWRTELGVVATMEGPWLTDGVVIYRSGTLDVSRRSVQERVIALDAGTGAKRWERKTDGLHEATVVADGVIYLHLGSQTRSSLLALQAGTGKLLWEFSARDIGAFRLRGDALYGRSDSDSYALDLRSGKLLWRVASGGAGRPYPPLIAGSTVLVGQKEGSLAALDARTGRVKWQFAKTGERLGGPPSVFGDRVFFRGWDGTNAGSIYAAELETGRVVMTVPTQFGRGSAPPAEGQTVYFTEGVALAAAAIPEGKRLWAIDIGKRGGDSPLVLVGEHLYLLSGDSNFSHSVIYRIDRVQKAVELGSNPMHGIREPLTPATGSPQTRPCVRVSSRVSPAFTHASRIDLETAQLVWTVPLPSDGGPVQCDERMLYYAEHSEQRGYAAVGVEIVDTR